MATDKLQGGSVPFGPDALWAPWRLPYLETVQDGPEPVAGPDNAPSPGAPGPCFLLDYWNQPQRDQEHHVIVRDTHGIILLNKYPYANGHLLVALGEGRPTLSDYAPRQRARLWELVDRGVALAERALEPQGLNIGINQGRAGGAGVPGHLHVHVIPRWGGDTNFITTVGGIRVIPSALEAMYERYMRVVESN